MKSDDSDDHNDVTDLAEGVGREHGQVVWLILPVPGFGVSIRITWRQCTFCILLISFSRNILSSHHLLFAFGLALMSETNPAMMRTKLGSSLIFVGIQTIIIPSPASSSSLAASHAHLERNMFWTNSGAEPQQPS